jgi:hypothetical protein
MSNTVVLGSITRKNGVPYEGMIFLDVDQPAIGVIAFYQDSLHEQGFTEWRPGNPQTFQTHQLILLCHKEKGIQLDIAAYETQTEPTDVRLSYSTNPVLISCDDDIPSMTTYAQQVLPTLNLPRDIISLGSGSGGGYTGWAFSEQQIISELSPTELDDYLRPQLEQAGWQLVAESRSAPVAWSQWVLTDVQGYSWSGLLTITSAQGSENARLLRFQIEQTY